MAGVYTQNRAVFQPMSLQEMMVPLQYLEGEHRALEQQNLELTALANTVAGDLDPNSGAYNQVKSYTDNLKSLAEDLMSNGYNNNIRRSLLEMKAAYPLQVGAVEKANAKLNAMRQQFADAQTKDPYMISKLDTNALNIDALLENPNLTNEFISGSALKEHFANSVKALAQRVLEDPGSYVRAGGDPYLFERWVNFGADPNTVYEMIEQDGNLLNKIAQDTVFSSGVTKFGPDATNRAFHIIRPAVTAAIGKTEYQSDKDSAGLAMLQNQLSQTPAGPAEPPGIGVRDIVYTTPSMMSENDKEVVDDLMKGFFNTQDPNSSVEAMVAQFGNVKINAFDVVVNSESTLGKAGQKIKKLFDFSGIPDDALLFEKDKDGVPRVKTAERIAEQYDISLEKATKLLSSIQQGLGRLGIDIKAGTSVTELAEEVKKAYQAGQPLNVEGINLESRQSPKIIERAMHANPNALRKVTKVTKDGKVVEEPLNEEDLKKVLESLQKGQGAISMFKHDPTKLVIQNNGYTLTVPMNVLTNNKEYMLGYEVVRAANEKYLSFEDKLAEQLLEQAEEQNPGMFREDGRASSRKKKQLFKEQMKAKLRVGELSQAWSEYNETVKRGTQAMIQSLTTSIGGVYDVNPDETGTVNLKKKEGYSYE